ncbi:MAG: hypothetical protein ABI255_07105 [Microbacteriaceae bacterium]
MRTLLALWRSPEVARVILGIGASATGTGLTVIWVARMTIPYTVYVSGLGADGMPTSGGFAFALLSIAAGAGLIASRSTGVRPRFRWLATWPPAATLLFAGCCFAAASWATCTAGCPVPLIDPASTMQDLVHTVTAVAGFAAACFAMLQVAFAQRSRMTARVSAACCLSVAAITIAGGVLAILKVAVDFGAWLELGGATLALGWLVGFGVSLGRVRS